MNIYEIKRIKIRLLGWDMETSSPTHTPKKDKKKEQIIMNEYNKNK